MITTSPRRGDSVVVNSFPRRFELEQELRAPLFLVTFADASCQPAEPVERAQEAAVLVVRPAHVARTPPTRLAETIEASVVGDAEVGVRLDVVACELAEARPGVEVPGPTRDDRGNRVALRCWIAHIERGRQRGLCVRRFRCEDGLGRALRAEAHGVLGHRPDCMWRTGGPMSSTGAGRSAARRPARSPDLRSSRFWPETCPFAQVRKRPVSGMAVTGTAVYPLRRGGASEEPPCPPTSSPA